MFSKETIEMAEKRERQSREFEKRFNSGDKNALREFCRIDPFAIKTEWFQNAVQKCMFAGDMSPLKNLFTNGKREKKNRFTEMTENLIIKDGVDRIALEKGLPKNIPDPLDTIERNNNTVYDFIDDNQIFTFGVVQALGAKAIFNRYHKAKKQTPYTMIEQIRGGVILRCGPTEVRADDKSGFGFYEHFYPADGGNMEFSVSLASNIPLGKKIEDVLPKLLPPIP